MNNVAQGKYFPSIKEFSLILLTFGLTVFAWIFFRAENISHAVQYISDIFKNPDSFFSLSVYSKYSEMLYLIGIFVIIEWLGREGQYAISRLDIHMRKPFRHVVYYAIIIAIYWFAGKEQQFIYFQF